MDIDKYDGGLSRQVIGAAIEVHRSLGPGLLESAYEHCLVREIQLRGLTVRRQVPLPITYKGLSVECSYRLDLVVENRIVIELKCVEALLPVHEAQILTYLRLSGYRIGLLMNFYVPVLKQGIIRKVL